jgi:hypothetical protein
MALGRKRSGDPVARANVLRAWLILNVSGQKKMNPPIAAGFVEITDSPRLFLTAMTVSAIYLFLISIPVRQLRRARAKERKGPTVILSLTHLLPFAVREVAAFIQGPYWRDWHFIWLYLIASVLLAGAYHIVVAAWRLIRRDC